jgi:hypothetical protein
MCIQLIRDAVGGVLDTDPPAPLARLVREWLGKTAAGKWAPPPHDALLWEVVAVARRDRELAVLVTETRSGLGFTSWVPYLHSHRVATTPPAVTPRRRAPLNAERLSKLGEARRLGMTVPHESPAYGPMPSMTADEFLETVTRVAAEPQWSRGRPSHYAVVKEGSYTAEGNVIEEAEYDTSRVLNAPGWDYPSAPAELWDGPLRQRLRAADAADPPLVMECFMPPGDHSGPGGCLLPRYPGDVPLAEWKGVSEATLRALNAVTELLADLDKRRSAESEAESNNRRREQLRRELGL